MAKAQDPFGGSYPITQKFGVPFWYSGRLLKHMGVDFACPKGTPIISVAPGVVERVQSLNVGYGKNVLINHYGWHSFYAHLTKMTVRKGEKVKVGTLIGYSGRTGFWRGKTGYHLHLGIKVAGKWVDPLPYLAQEKSAPISEAEEAFDGIRYYTVKRGDSLWRIAKKFYGHGSKWRRIWNENRKTIKHYSLIYPGQRIKIP